MRDRIPSSQHPDGLVPSGAIELAEGNPRERAAFLDAFFYLREPVTLRKRISVPFDPFQKQLKLLTASGGGSRHRLPGLCRVPAAIEQVEGGYMVVALHALVERLTEIVPVCIALNSPRKLFYNDVKLTA